MNLYSLNVDLEWAFATKRWLRWALPDPDPEFGTSTGTGLEDEGSMANPDADELMHGSDHPQSATAPGLGAPGPSSGDRNTYGHGHGHGRNRNQIRHHQPITAKGEERDDAALTPQQTAAPASAPAPATQPQPVPRPPGPQPLSIRHPQPPRRPEHEHPRPRARDRPKPISKNGPAPRDDRFDLTAQSKENKIYMENGHPPLLSRRIWPVTADLDHFDTILSKMHPELSYAMRKGVINRIQFFRERIWDGWLHPGLKRMVHGSGAIEGWGFRDEEDVNEEDEGGFCILEGGQARGLEKISLVCDEGGWFQGRDPELTLSGVIPVREVTHVTEITERQRKEKEVANHVKALTHAIERMIVGEPTRDGADPQWTEKFIKDIHATLLGGLCRRERKGEYRIDDEVGDEFTTDADKAEADTEAEDDASVISLSSSSSSLFSDQSFVDDDDEGPGDIQAKKKKYLGDWYKRNGKMCLRSSAVKEYMGRMIEELNQDIGRIQLAHLSTISPASSSIKTDSSRERRQKNTNHPQCESQQQQKQPKPLDPYSLAAKHAHRFLMISPFTSGNGIISRLIMNVLLLKYAGKIAPFGANSREKEEYLGIISRAARKFHVENIEGIDFAEQTSHLEMAGFLRMKSEGFESDSDSDWTEL